ncbi:MAG: sigma-54 dependent transcriptional regulator [Cytophagales bacterium]|nr:sigma-54 dependent transcriptional regulator [Cytophagales bacterium]
MSKAHILVIDDEADICLLLNKFFTKKGYEVTTAQEGKEAEKILKKQTFEVVICDFKLPDYDGLELLEKIKIIQPRSRVIIITGYSDVRIAVQTLKKGAFDYVTKPLYPDEIHLTVQNALEQTESAVGDTKTKASQKVTKQPDSTFVWGESSQSQVLQKHIALIAPTDLSVLILGETGTGKEYAARAIHDKSKRNNQPFVAVDCGALPNELAGSELFGHVKGAFTGAVSDKKGCFELAHGGTLFLDEIGNLSYDNQIKLLRVLQDHKIKRLGSETEQNVDVRIIAATNEDLSTGMDEDEFREDLFHRVNEFRIDLAPLRKRKADIPAFAQHFLTKANARIGREVVGFDDSVLDLFKEKPWHGNLRELDNVIKRAVLLTEGAQIKMEVLPPELIQATQDAQEVMTTEFPTTLRAVVEKAEKQAILATLQHTGNNKSETAKLLDVDRKTLYNKLNQYEIEH